MEFARGRAQTLLDDKIMAPLYRLPNTCFTTCYPELLSDGALSEAESTALMAFYSEVDTLNRGLDQAADAKDQSQLVAEYDRNLLKAKRLVSGAPLYVAATTAVDSHLK
jgi:hypothetical protein